MERAQRKTVGVVLDWLDSTGAYQRLVLDGIRAFAREHDLNLLAFAVGRLETPFLWERGRGFLFDYVSPELMDGLIVYTAAIAGFSGMQALRDRLGCVVSIPTVSVSAELPQCSSVVVDNRAGLVELVTHLVRDHGCRSLAYVGGPERNVEASIRRQTVLQTARELGVPIPDERVYHGTFVMESGREAAIALFGSRHPDVDAVICANDSMAIGLWQELWSRKVAVPLDVAVTGFDDLEVSTLLELPFTTVRQPLRDLGRTAMQMLYDRMVGVFPKDRTETRVLGTRVIYRRSCGCPAPERSDPAPNPAAAEEKPRDGQAFYAAQRASMKNALRYFRERRGGDPIVRAWNAVLLHGIERRIKQGEISLLLEMVRADLMGGELAEGERRELLEKLEKMGSMVIDFYIQADVLTRLMSESSLKNTMFAIDDFEQATITYAELESSLERLVEILQHAGIATCLLSRFDDGEADPRGSSTLIFAYHTGRRIALPAKAPRFQSSQVFHPQYVPSGRYELLVQALYEGSEKIGLVCLGMDAHGTDTYEMLRRRLSGVIRSVSTTDRLRKLNRQLESEIQVREGMERKLKEALEELQDLSLRDELTGLYNRRGFLTVGEQQLRYCLREGESCVVLYLDLNGLKQINDTHGHNEGDRALRTAAGILRTTFRDVDIIARLGGDEFTVFAGKADASRVRLLQDRLTAVSQRVNTELQTSYHVEMSMGFYEYSPEGPDSLAQMLDLADQRMYREKERLRGER